MPTEIEEIKKIVQETEHELQVLNLKIDKIRRKMLWSQVYGFIKLLIIFVPLVYAYFVYQPQLLRLYQSMDTVMRKVQELEQQSITIPQLSPDALLQIQRQNPQLFQQRP